MENEKKKKKISSVDPVLIGASMLTPTLLHPFDMLKLRMQLGQGSAAQIASNMLKSEGGYAAFYKGLSATLFSAPLQNVVRFTSYPILVTMAILANDRKPLSPLQNAMYSSTAATMACAFTMPIGLAQIRMQADGTFPTAHRRNYRNVFNALNRVIADEGVGALWRGLGPSSAKTFVQVSVSFYINSPTCSYLNDSLGCGFITSIIGTSAISTFFGCALSLPFDYVKTQLQTMQPDAYGRYPYTGSFDCARKTLKTGGLAKFYSGFHFYYFRYAPSTTLSLVGVVLLHHLDESISGKKITVNFRRSDV